MAERRPSEDNGGQSGCLPMREVLIKESGRNNILILIEK